jgi:pSer/pThr/pTyr-binding forkhead associated (FHA) protein
MGDISGVRPVEKIEKLAPDIADSQDNQSMPAQSATVREVRKNPPQDRLVLVSISAARNGDILPINNGDILGREHVGKDLFAVYPTVGRRHAKVACLRGEWTIEDLDSTNGTYINGRKLEAGQKYPLKAKDILALSKSCELLVEMGECI